VSDLFGQLGINLPMLLAQAVNFAVLLIVLTVFVYKPMIKMFEERRKKIELGIKGAELAEAKLAEAEQTKKDKLTEADKEAVKIIGLAQSQAGLEGQKIVAVAEAKSENILAEAALTAERKKVEEMEKLSVEASRLVRAAIVKAVELDPSQVDEKLVAEAVKLVKQG